MKITNFNVSFLLFLFVLSFFLSASNQTARWGLAPDETFGVSLFVFFIIFLGNSAISLMMESHHNLASSLTIMVMIIGGLSFAFILSFAIYTKNYNHRYYWMFATLILIYIAGITSYARFKKYKSNH